MKISYTQYSLIAKWLESGKTEDFDKALNYYLGITEPPTPAMEKGTKIHKVIAEEDLTFTGFEQGTRDREKHIEIDYGEHILHGYADCIIDEAKLVDYKVSGAELYKPSMFYRDGLFQHYKDQLHFYSLILPELNFGKLIRVGVKKLKKSGIEKIVLVQESETVEFNSSTRVEMLGKVMIGVEKFEYKINKKT